MDYRDNPSGRNLGSQHNAPASGMGKAKRRLKLPTGLSVKVAGRPSHVASLLEIGLCRYRWLAGGVIPLWLLNLAVLNEVALGEFREAAQHYGTHWEPIAAAMISAPLAFGLLTITTVLIFSNGTISIRRARVLATLAVIGPTGCEGLQLGLSHIHTNQMHAFNLAMLVTFTLVPIRLGEQIGIAVCALGLPLGSALVTGLHQQSGEESRLWLLTIPMAFAVIGIVLNRWETRNFRLRWLSNVAIQRKTREIERQKEELERQKAEADRQRTHAVQALASALTRPVAEVYQSKGTVQPSLKSVCVIACDAVGFSKACEKLQPERIVFELRKFFRAFDEACLRYRIEPLRAQGDSRLAIAGLWMENPEDLHKAVINAVLAMLDFRRVLPSPDGTAPEAAHGKNVLWPARIGINLGSVSTGVIDTTPERTSGLDTDNGENDPPHEGRLWFDVWGDAVNVAARLQQGATPNQVAVRANVLWETRGLFDHGPIGPLHVKETVIPDYAEIVGIRDPYRDTDGKPNGLFWDTVNDPERSPQPPSPQGTLGLETEGHAPK